MNNEDIDFNFDDYYTYHRGEYRKSKTFKLTLFNLRKYFLVHNTLFIFLKIFLGVLFLGLPIFLFKKILNSNNLIDNSQINSSYYLAGLPMIISVLIFLSYVVVVIILKSIMLCQTRL